MSKMIKKNVKMNCMFFANIWDPTPTKKSKIVIKWPQIPS